MSQFNAVSTNSGHAALGNTKKVQGSNKLVIDVGGASASTTLPRLASTVSIVDSECYVHLSEQPSTQSDQRSINNITRFVIFLLCSVLRRDGKPKRNRTGGQRQMPLKRNVMLTSRHLQQGMATHLDYRLLKACSTLPTALRPPCFKTDK